MRRQSTQEKTQCRMLLLFIWWNKRERDRAKLRNQFSPFCMFSVCILCMHISVYMCLTHGTVLDELEENFYSYPKVFMRKTTFEKSCVYVSHYLLLLLFWNGSSKRACCMCVDGQHNIYNILVHRLLLYIIIFIVFPYSIRVSTTLVIWSQNLIYRHLI